MIVTCAIKEVCHISFYFLIISVVVLCVAWLKLYPSILLFLFLVVYTSISIYQYTYNEYKYIRIYVYRDIKSISSTFLTLSSVYRFSPTYFLPCGRALFLLFSSSFLASFFLFLSLSFFFFSFSLPERNFEN